MSERNGDPRNVYRELFDYVGDVSPEALREGKRKLRLMETAYRFKRLSSLTRMVESLSSTGRWVDVVNDRLDAMRGDPWGAGGYGSQQDRGHGKNYPIFSNEQDLSLIRMQSRILCATNSYAIGLLEGVTSYTLGTGCTYTTTSAHEEQPAPDELLAACQDIIDGFLERNQWFGGEQPGIEEELLWRESEDGESILLHFIDPSGNVSVRTVEPEHILQPPGSDLAEYSFGVRTPKDDVQDHQAIWVADPDHPGEGKEYTRDRYVHVRCNVKRSIKRGLPDFCFSAMDSLHVGDKLRNNMSLGAAIQACYVGVRQHDSATQSDVQGMQELLSDYQRTNPNTGRQESYQKHVPGIHDVPKGQNWVNPPTATNAAAHVEILQACLRGGGTRWNAPEWLTSGLHDTSSFASSLTAESPFLRRIQRRQTSFCAARERSAWIALEAKVKRNGGLLVRMEVLDGAGNPTGRFAERRFSWEEVRRLVKVMVEAPNPQTRDKLADAQAHQIYLQSKVMSPQAVQQELGLDAEQELVNWEEWQERTGGVGQALPLPGEDGTLPDDGLGAGDTDQAAGAAQSNDLRATVGGLNAIAGLQADYYAGKVPREAAIANARLLFGFSPAEAAALFPEVVPQKLTADNVPAPDAKSTMPESLQEADDDTKGIKAAKNAVDRALKDGTLTRKKCEECGARGTEAHHEDYRKPLDVTWLCRACHDKAHGKDVPEGAAPTLPLPDIRQETDYSCGAAALQSVLAFFGVPGDEATLRARLGTEFTSGTDADEIAAVAQRYGLSADARQGMTLDELRQTVQAGKPVIALIQAHGVGHYVVVAGVSDDTLSLQDPAAGPVEMPADEFAARWVHVGEDNVSVKRLGVIIGRG